MSQVVVQKLHKREDSQLKMVVRYFNILMATSDIRLTPKQLELLAFTAWKGNISSGGARQGFIESFDSSEGTLDNLKISLAKKGLFIKGKGKRGKYRINPRLALDFSKDIVLQITLDTKPDGLPEDGEDKTE